jgi:hypothetical protein
LSLEGQLHVYAHDMQKLMHFQTCIHNKIWFLFRTSQLGAYYVRRVVYTWSSWRPMTPFHSHLISQHRTLKQHNSQKGLVKRFFVFVQQRFTCNIPI